IAAIAMGVGVDAAIQYTVRYRAELAATGGDRRAAVTRSHATIGRSIWIATSIMVAGFAVLSLSDFVPTVMFGLFNALAMVMGQFAALTVLPSLFLLTGLPRHGGAKRAP
ncbi:MAG TPA: MMPL family transporter, partial [Planctomycetota bacterium]|nr:MMPL family transporter [Planctomycetota bacterium]